MEQHGQGGKQATPASCGAYFYGTDAARIRAASQAFMRLARGYFIAGCMAGGGGGGGVVEAQAP